MERKIEFSVEEFYHIYNRGNDKKIIFLDNNDRKRFIKLLFLCNSTKSVVIRDLPKGDTFVIDRGEQIVDIGVYCLMPNHFHILIREKIEGGISKFMKKLSTGYSMYFNRKNRRTGKLFEGVFKAEHVDKDEYLKYLFAYIHLNPVKLIDPGWKEKGLFDAEKTERYLLDYQYSSYLDYTGRKRAECSILNKAAFPEYFDDFNDFEFFIQYWLNFSKDFPR